MTAINLTHADILACERELGRRSLADFARMAWPTLEPAAELKWGWALDAICEHLEAVSAGQSKRMLMNVPPGSMKSLLTGVIMPAWEWIERPELRFLGTAHKQDLAVRDNMKCRRLIQSGWYQTRWPIALTSDQNAKTKYENSATGFREAMAFTSMTGSRGDRVILDDPHSVDDANSPVRLHADIMTFREALPSRVNNDESAIIIIMQRLNEADVSAVAIDLGYDHLCIPMRYEVGRSKWVVGTGDPRTVDGELMFAERFPETQVQELERTMGAYATAGQLQQRPAPRDGGLFKPSWFHAISVMPADIKRTVRGWDLAATAKSTSNNPDWTAGVIMSRLADGSFLIHGCRRFQGSPMDVESAILQQAAIDGKGVTVRLAQDPGQAGKAQAEMMVRKLAGYTVKVERPTGDKATRASPLAAQAEAGNVKILITGDPSRDAWVQPFLDELCMFPAGANDDQVDAAADAFSELALGSSRYNIAALT